MYPKCKTSEKINFDTLLSLRARSIGNKSKLIDELISSIKQNNTNLPGKRVINQKCDFSKYELLKIWHKSLLPNLKQILTDEINGVLSFDPNSFIDPEKYIYFKKLSLSQQIRLYVKIYLCSKK